MKYNNITKQLSEIRGIYMVRLRIIEILEEQGKSRYWLSKRMGMHYVSFKNMIENNTSSIRFDTLDKISTLLNVPVGDLFEKVDDPSEKTDRE